MEKNIQYSIMGSACVHASREDESRETHRVVLLYKTKQWSQPKIKWAHTSSHLTPHKLNTKKWSLSDGRALHNISLHAPMSNLHRAYSGGEEREKPNKHTYIHA